MSGLKDISVRVVDGFPAASAPAILREVEALLARLTETGEPGVIDLRGVPMAAADFEMLARELGEGEVSATIVAGGPSTVRETAYSGVWWVTHRGDDGEILSEFIEVTRMPEILLSQPEDMLQSARRLRARLAQST